MKCYYHPTEDAVGICKSCCKGLCQDCAIDLGKGMACRDRCELVVKAIIENNDRAMRLNKKVSSTTSIIGFMFIVLGLVFAGWGIALGPEQYFQVIIGIVFAIFGAVVLVRYAIIARTEKRRFDSSE